MEEINEYLDLGLEEFPGWEIGYLPFSVQPVDASTLPNGGKEPAEPGDAEVADGMTQDAIGKLRQMILARAAQAPASKQSQGDIALWKKHEASRRSGEKVTHSAVTKSLMSARSEVLANIAAMPDTAEKSAMASSLNFNAQAFADQFQSAMNKAIQFNLKKASVEFLDEVGADNPWKLSDARASVYLNERDNLLSGVPDEVHQSVEAQLDEGLKAGESKGELSARIRSLFNDMSKGRADTIAQTETGGAYSFARDEGMKETGVAQKRWLSAPDDRTRISHQMADGQTVPINEPFIIQGEELMFPGDSSQASADNVINCRCVSVSVLSPIADSSRSPSRFKVAAVLTAAAMKNGKTHS